MLAGGDGRDDDSVPSSPPRRRRRRRRRRAPPPSLAALLFFVLATSAEPTAEEDSRGRGRRSAKKKARDERGGADPPPPPSATAAAAGEEGAVGREGRDLLVCRNLHLDEAIFRAPSLPGPAPYRSRSVTEEMVVGGGSDDTDVTSLLDGDDRFGPSVDLRLRFLSNYPDAVKLLMVDYTTDGAGFRIGSETGPALDGSHPAVRKYATSSDERVVDPSSGGGRYVDATLSIPPDSYVNPGDAPWADMRRIAVAYGLPAGLGPGAEAEEGAPLRDVEVRLQLVRLCAARPPPHFCSEPTADEYRTRGHDCGCRTCHGCGCSAAPPWAGECDAANGPCGSDQGGCWCGVACRCCSDCAGYPCDCETCFDTTSLRGCALGSTFAVEDVVPPDGIASVTNEVVVRGRGFFGNAPNITCRFGPVPAPAGDGGRPEKEEAEKKAAVEVPGMYRSPTEIFCSVPPRDLPPGTSGLIVPVSISLDGRTFTDPSANPNATFTYLSCPNGCNGGGNDDEDHRNGNATQAAAVATSCPATSCSCPSDRYGPDCSLKCDECVRGICGSVTGGCNCEPGWTGSRCQLRCPGADDADGGGACSGRGACYAAGGGGAEGGPEGASCRCPPDYWGDACRGDCPRDAINGDVCGRRGTCDQRTGLCDCEEGYYGESCSRECPGMAEVGTACSGRGICCTGRGASATYSQCRRGAVELGRCACDAGWGGRSCERPACFNDCYGHGMCTSNGTCVCAEGYAGTFCSLRRGQDASRSYVSFADSSYTVTEEQGSVAVTVVRSGNLTEEVSVRYETGDLTATAGEDYAALNDRLRWSPMDGTARTVDVRVLPNDWPEGQESFEVVLGDPVPPDRCEVGGTGVAAIRIAAKAEAAASSSASEGRGAEPSVAARITIRISRPFDAVRPGEIGGEEMRAALRDAAALAVSIDPSRIYYRGNNDLRPTEFGRVLLTFDILPPLPPAAAAGGAATAGSKSAREAADDFVRAVADGSSALYGRGMDRLCPIDVAFMPEVRMVPLGGDDGGSGGSGRSAAGVVLVLVLSAAAAAAALAYRRRERLLGGLLRWLSHREFMRIRDDGEGYGEPGASGFSEFAVARYESGGGGGGLREGLKRKVLQIELT